MKGMQKIVRGRGFRGELEYLDEDGKARIIGGNMDGRNARELAAEFKAGRDARPEVEKHVWHSSMRLPKGDVIAEEKWCQIADDYMSRLGFTDMNQRVYFLENYEDGQHVHIVANRAGIDGSLYLGRNENLESTKIIGQLEREYGLTLTKQRDDLEPTKRREKTHPKRNEIKKSEREVDLPARVQLQELISQAMKNRPTTTEFLGRLREVDVTPRANVASTGKMNGMSFEYMGVAYRGSHLGDRFKWSRIEKEIDFDITRDRAALENTTKPAPEAQKTSAAEEPKTLTPREHKEVAWDRQADALQAPLYRITAVERLPAAEIEAGAMGWTWNLGKQKTPITTAVKDVLNGRDGQATTGTERFWSRDEVKKKIPMLSRLNQQLRDIYITPIDDSQHHILVDDIRGLEEMVRLQAQFKPCLIQTSSRKINESGKPEINLQAVIRIPKSGLSKAEQSAANVVLQELNNDFGDPKISGVRRPFRMSGFSNKKEGREDYLTRIKHAESVQCPKTAALLADAREVLKREREGLERLRDYKADPLHEVEQGRTASFAVVAGWYQEEFKRQEALAEALVDRGTWQRIRYGSVDFNATRELLKKGRNPREISEVLNHLSPELYAQRGTREGKEYGTRTVDAVLKAHPELAPKRVSPPHPADRVADAHAATGKQVPEFPMRGVVSPVTEPARVHAADRVQAAHDAAQQSFGAGRAAAGPSIDEGWNGPR